MAKIGVEQSLTSVSEALRGRGHEVIELKQESDAAGCDACVITGLDSNVMGMADVSIQGSVIEANGLTAEEVCSHIENSLS
ncbi:YkuS family protein [Peribacillus sp. SCS-26]|uniref:YkuS family protein n=1 Tax=Paraperibacillus marinus TaxID=3115295 RepID=UPI003906634C